MSTVAPSPGSFERRHTDAAATTSIDELLALPAEDRVELLTALRAGRHGPSLIVNVPQLVRTVRVRSPKDTSPDLGE